MQREPFESSVIAGAAYERSTRTLELQFQSGAIYRYRDVPPEIVRDMGEASSIGSFFSKQIRNRFVARRVSEPRAS